MTDRALFAALIKVLGIFSMGFSLWYLPFWISTAATGAASTNFMWGFITFFVVGLLLVRGTRILVGFAYSGDEDYSKPDHTL